MPASLPRPLRSAVKEHLRPLVAQLLRDVVADDNDGERYVDDATEVLLRRIGGMAPHLGAGMALLTLCFEGWSLARGGAPFVNQAPAQRQRRFDEWRRLPGPLASWSQFYDKMGTFAYWAVVEEREHGHSGVGHGEHGHSGVGHSEHGHSEHGHSGHGHSGVGHGGVGR